MDVCAFEELVQGMGSRSRTAAVVAATAVAMFAAGLPAAAEQEPSSAAGHSVVPPAATLGQRTVTLISGDRVGFTGSGSGLQV
ncbi:hypothetical protein, partial [Streptomyces sp. NPDC059744]|uniref:hypothetical protein n=1 Tax=Streptomyces sp. NPDC059744 TaxID=3346929 RepID=UPI00365C3259